MCDKYGMGVWDEFFQPNPNDGRIPPILNTCMANVRDKILRSPQSSGDQQYPRQ